MFAQEFFVEAPAGSVVFTHCGILHAGSVNRLPATRFFISCYINRVGLPVRDIQQGPVCCESCILACRFIPLDPSYCSLPAAVSNCSLHDGL